MPFGSARRNKHTICTLKRTQSSNVSSGFFHQLQIPVGDNFLHQLQIHVGDNFFVINFYTHNFII